MVNTSKIKIHLLRVFIITGLMLTMVFPGSAQALTQKDTVDANAAIRGGALRDIPQSRRNVGQLAPFAGILPPGTSFLPSYLVNTTDTSIWNHPSSDPAGIAYWPLTGKLLISDTEIEEAPQPYWDGFNVFQSTLAGNLSSDCTTFTSLPANPSSYNNFSEEPAGVTINTNNNHIFFSDDVSKRIFEVDRGVDNTYCTSDDIITSVSIGIAPFNVNDPEDLAYASGKLYIASGMDAEVYEFNLGADGKLGGGDDSSATLTHFDTAALGFNDVEGIAYNSANGTLFLLSTADGDTYLGEATTSGDTLLRAYDLSYLGHVRRSGLTVAPASGNPSVNNVYIVSRGLDNATHPDDYNDGKIWEISLSGSNPADLIFKDGFESGDLSAWTLNSPNSGKLSASPSAALFGTYGMSAEITSTTGMDVTDDQPTFETRYRARFYFDPNSIAMTSGDTHNIFQGYYYVPDTGAFPSVLQIEFRYSGGQYQVRSKSTNDSGTSIPTPAWYTITDALHFIEVDWKAASAAGANDGYLTLWVDGDQKANVTSLDNDTRRIDRVKLGPVSGLDVGTSGTYYFDAFESHRQSYIGPANPPPTVFSVTLADGDPTNAASVDYWVIFSESVTGVDTTDFDLTTTGVSGAMVSGVSGSGAVYTVTVDTGTDSGTIRLDVLDDDSIVDSDMNPLDSGFTNGEVYTIDKAAPIVSSITRADINPTSAPSVNYTLIFSESVTGVEIGDFALTPIGVSGASVSGVSGSGSVYTVTVNTGTGNGTIRLDVADNDSIVDGANNPLGGVGTGNGDFTTGEVYDVEKTVTTTLKSAGANDGWILELSETSGTGGTMNSTATTFNLGDNAADKQYRAILSFNTSSLPDNAVITKVTLKVKQHSVVGGGDPVSLFQGFKVDIKTGIFGTGALELGDFQATASKSYGPFSPALSSGWYSLNLTIGKGFINKVGHTQLRLRFTLDDNNNNLANFLRLYSGNAGVAVRPQLIIEYSMP